MLAREAQEAYVLFQPLRETIVPVMAVWARACVQLTASFHAELPNDTADQSQDQELSGLSLDREHRYQ